MAARPPPKNLPPWEPNYAESTSKALTHLQSLSKVYGYRNVARAARRAEWLERIVRVGKELHAALTASMDAMGVSWVPTTLEEAEKASVIVRGLLNDFATQLMSKDLLAYVATCIKNMSDETKEIAEYRRAKNRYPRYWMCITTFQRIWYVCGYKIPGLKSRLIAVRRSVGGSRRRFRRRFRRRYRRRFRRFRRYRRRYRRYRRYRRGYRRYRRYYRRRGYRRYGGYGYRRRRFY